MIDNPEVTAEAIRRAWNESGALSAALELRQHFPSITDNAMGRECVRGHRQINGSRAAFRRHKRAACGSGILLGARPLPPDKKNSGASRAVPDDGHRGPPRTKMPVNHPRARKGPAAPGREI